MKHRDPIVQYAGSPSIMHDAMIELIGGCARHPDVSLVVAEFNAGWIARRLDEVQHRHRHLRPRRRPRHRNRDDLDAHPIDHHESRPTTLLNDPRPISAASHALEGPEGFEGLVERFGDDAPRVVHRRVRATTSWARERSDCVASGSPHHSGRMIVETLLPLGKLDPGLREPDTPLDIRRFGDLAAVAEDVGLDAVLVEETKDDPYQLLALGAAATERIGLGTSVAMAFARSPTATAMSAWSLQKLSGGRFLLGLGTQVRAHVERRFGMEWSAPAPRMRDYIGAMRAVWHSWQTGERLAYESEHYRLDLMVPLFDPGPIDQPEIPIHLAAIGPNMCAVAGEVADGIRLHPVCTPAFIDAEVLPNVARGAARTQRSLDEVEVCIKPLVGTAPDAERLRGVERTVRERVAFYLSTPSYRRTFRLHGWEDVAVEASALARARRWDDLPGLVTDEMLHTVATIGTHGEIGSMLRERYAGRVDRIEFSIPVETPDDADRLRSILDELRAT